MTNSYGGFAAFDAIDMGRRNYYAKLSAEEKKKFAFPVIMRWASNIGSNDKNTYDWYVLAINDRANVNCQTLGNHPEMFFRLMASCGLGKLENHKWIPMAKRLPPKDILMDFLRMEWPSANELECEILLKQIDEDSLISLIRDIGLSPEKSEEVIEAYATYTGKPKRKAKRKKR